MIKNMASTDKVLLMQHFHLWLYDRSVKYFDEQIEEIAIENQRRKMSVLKTFAFGGEVFKYEESNVRFPQLLDKSFYPRMNEVKRQRDRILGIEASYATTAFAAALSAANWVQDLYQLLPELVHPFLSQWGIPRDYPEDGEPLDNTVVLQFMDRQKTNLEMIHKRATRNLVGIIQ